MSSKHLPGVKRGGAAPPKVKRIATSSSLGNVSRASSSARSTASSSRNVNSVSSRVAVRVRPFSLKEKNHSDRVVTLEGQKVSMRNPFSNDETVFKVDFSHDSHSPKSAGYASNSDVYDGIGRALCQSVLEGYDSTLLSYGMAASGKTHTMCGSRSGVEEGILQLFVRQLFQEFRSGMFGQVFSVEMTALEVYNDAVYDLMDKGKVLKVRDANGVYIVDGEKRVAARSEADLLDRVNKALAAARKGAIKINKTSSRSHVVVQLHVTAATDRSEKRSTVTLVDLSGIQKNEHTEATGERAKEQQYINRGLAAIANVIQDTLDRKALVRFREHILTKILKNAFQRSKLFWLGCIHAGDIMHDEGVTVLRFLEKARSMKTMATPTEAQGISSARFVVSLDKIPSPKKTPPPATSKIDLGAFDDSLQLEDEHGHGGDDDDDNDDDEYGGTATLGGTNQSLMSTGGSQVSTRSPGSSKAKTSLSVLIRPQTVPELKHNIMTARPVDRQDLVMIQPFSGEETVFRVDHALGDETLENEASALLSRQVASDILHGYHTTLMAYGLSGSGKTRALFGEKRANNSVLYALLVELLDADATIEARVVELYRDAQLTDLLELGGPSLRLGETKDGTGVAGLSTISIDSEQDIERMMQAVQTRRHVGSTELNAPFGSRSTVVMYFTVSHHTSASVLSVIDLPGTQPPELTKAAGDELTEQKYINKSLANLHVILNGLASNKSSLLPWRETAMAKLLKPSLTGRRLHLLGAIHSGDLYYDSTITIVRNLDLWRGINLKAKPSTMKASASAKTGTSGSGKRPARRGLPALTTQRNVVGASPASTPTSARSSAALGRSPSNTGSTGSVGSSTPRRKASTWKTAVRVRGLNKDELSATFARDVITCRQDGVFMTNPFSEQSTRYSSDKTYPTQATNDDVNQDIGGDLVADVLSGYDTSVLAYGITGGGKTHTLLGNRVTGITKETGLIDGFVEQLYTALEKKNKFSVEVVALEIYNESIASLHGGTTQDVRLRESEGTFVIDDHLAVPAPTLSDCKQLITTACSNTPFASTAVNPLSSRAHIVFQFRVSIDNAAATCVTIADLAGLQRNELTKSTGDRQKEEMAINKSLACLTQVVQARAKKSSLIPYRNSALTKVLQEPLRSTKMILLGCLAGSGTLFDETTSVMRFLASARSLRGLLKNK